MQSTFGPADLRHTDSLLEISFRLLHRNSYLSGSGKTKNKMGGRRPEGHFTGPRNTRMEKMSKEREEWRRLVREATSQNGL